MTRIRKFACDGLFMMGAVLLALGLAVMGLSTLLEPDVRR